MLKKTLLISSSLALSLLSATWALAETVEFGGSDQRFRGEGDNTPPQCTIGLPKGSSTPFSVLWACTDGESKEDELKSELWLTRLGADAPVLLNSFLGFPAGAVIDEKTLKVTNFTDGLPIKLRLVVKDRAGNAATSEVFTVRAQDVSVDNCNLSITTSATEATEETTGLPAMSLTMNDVKVSVVDNSETNFIVSTTEETPSTTCEIDNLCSDKEELTFKADVTLDSRNQASAQLAVSPGELQVSLSGTSETQESVLTRLSLSGKSTIDGAEAEVSLNCAQ